MSGVATQSIRISNRKSTGRLSGHVRPVAALSEQHIEAMWRVFVRYYDAIDRDRFVEDLQNKDFVILLRDSGDGSVQGFSTILVYDRKVEGRPFVAIFSGDTIIEEKYWGQSALQKTFVRFVTMQKLSHPLKDVYWFLISKGYKTYLLLSRNFPEHWPRHDRPMPVRIKKMLDLLAMDRFGDTYQPDRGILRFEACPGKLKSAVAPIDGELMANNPDIRFFAERNPGHERGDELCCLGRVDLIFAVYFTGRLLRKVFEKIIRRPQGIMRRWARLVRSS